MSVQDVWARMMQGGSQDSRIREEARVAANAEVIRLREKLAEAEAALGRASDILAIQRRAFLDAKAILDRATLDCLAVEAKP